MSIAKNYGLKFFMYNPADGERLVPYITCSNDVHGDPTVNAGIAEYLRNTGPNMAQQLIDELSIFHTETDPDDSFLVNYPIYGTDDFVFYMNQNTLYPNDSMDAFYVTFKSSGGIKSDIPLRDLILLLGEWRDYLNSFGSKHNLANM